MERKKTGDSQPPIKKITEGAEEALDEMDAIARGVEARYDVISVYSSMMIELTVDVARQLGIPEIEIKRWAVSRARHDTEKSEVIRPLLTKLDTSLSKARLRET